MSTYHSPENLGATQDERDAAIPGRRFFVYVLETSNGHYVGHTARLKARMREHRNGEVESTVGSDPNLVWRSGPFGERHDAARFEAALKSMRDSGAGRFTEITGLQPEPFVKSFTVVPFGDAGPGKASKLIRRPVAVGAAMGAVLGLLWAFDFDVSALGVGAIKVVVLIFVCAIGLPLLIWLAPRMARFYLSPGRASSRRAAGRTGRKYRRRR